jgi:hypothetical protein
LAAMISTYTTSRITIGISPVFPRYFVCYGIDWDTWCM